MVNTLDPERRLDFGDLHVAQRLERVSDGAICYLGHSQPGLATRTWRIFREGAFIYELTSREIIKQFQQPQDVRKTHELKTWPEYYDLVAAGLKTYEIRLDDRQYKAGDTLHLRRFHPQQLEYTGEDCYVEVLHVLPACDAFGLKERYVALSLGPVFPF